MRLEAKRLQERFRRAAERRSPADLVEIVEGRQAVRHRVGQLFRSTQSELLAFDKPPYSVGPGDPLHQEDQQLERGMAWRVIYAKESLEYPGALERIAFFTTAGEEARYLAELPMKLSIFDRRVAVMPVSQERGAIEGALIVHSSHLLDALIALWESSWERAAPLPREGEALPDRDMAGAALTAEEAQLVALLLAGGKSETIARNLDIGLSTVERRIKRLMQRLGSETRFQAGFELGRRSVATNEPGTRGGGDT